MAATKSCGVVPAFSAAIMVAAPCASSAPTKCTSWPLIRCWRTLMSAWMYSMMWPMWSGPLAYGRAVVTNSRRVMVFFGPDVLEGAASNRGGPLLRRRAHSGERACGTSAGGDGNQGAAHKVDSDEGHSNNRDALH